MFAAGLGLVLVAMTFGALGQWTGLEAGAGLVGGGALIAMFILIERRERFPMLDLSLFRNREFTETGLATFLNALGRGAFIFVMVFYLQGPPTYLSPLTAGLFLIPVSASLAIMGPLSGIFSDRYGRKWFTVTGLVLSGGAFLWLAAIPSAAPFALLLGPFVLLGAGMGLFASPNRAAMMSAVPPERRGIASGVGTTLMNTGATIGLGLTLAIMSTALPISALESILLGSQTSTGPNEAAQFLAGIHTVFFVSAALTGAALLVILWGRGRGVQRSGGATDGSA